MKDSDLSLTSVGAVALSLLSGVILIAPGTLSAREDPDTDKAPPADEKAKARGTEPDAAQAAGFARLKKENATKDTITAGKGAIPAGTGGEPAGKDATPVRK